MQQVIDRDIAAAISNENTKASVFAELIRQIDNALELSKKAKEAEEIRFLDPTNLNPEKSKAAIDRIALADERMKHALVILQQRYKAASADDQSSKWSKEYARVEKQRNELARELIHFYPAFVDKFVGLFQRIGDLEKKIDAFNGSAPSNDPRRLKTTELKARDMDHFTISQPSLAKEVRLPHAGETSRLAWPIEDFSFAIQASNAIASAMAGKVGYSDQWHEAKKIDDANKIVEWEQRNALLEKQKEAEKKEFIAAQRQAARGK